MDMHNCWSELKAASYEILLKREISLPAEDFINLINFTKQTSSCITNHNDGNFSRFDQDLILMKLHVLTVFYEDSKPSEKCNEVYTMVLKDAGLLKVLLGCLGHENTFVSFSAGKCVLSMLKLYDQRGVLSFTDQFLTSCLTEMSSDAMLCNGMGICSQLLLSCCCMNHKPDDDHFLQRAETFNRVMKHVSALWPSLIKRTNLDVLNTSLLLQSLCTLWRAVLIAYHMFKSRLKGQNLQLFHNFSPIFDTLRKSQDPVIWRCGLSVLNKAMCFGKLISAGELIYDYKVIAESIVEKMIIQRCVFEMPFRTGFVGFGWTIVEESSHGMDLECDYDGDVSLLKKTVMLVLRTVAILCYQTSCSDTGRAMDYLETCKQLTVTHRAGCEDRWPMSLFEDQDDLLVECLLCLFMVTSKVYKKLSIENTLEDYRNPNNCFQELLRTVAYDHTVLLDFILSPETCFLVYSTNYLHFIVEDWNGFCKSLQQNKPVEQDGKDEYLRKESQMHDRDCNGKNPCEFDSSCSGAECEQDLQSFRGKKELTCQLSLVDYSDSSSSDEEFSNVENQDKNSVQNSFEGKIDQSEQGICQDSEKEQFCLDAHFDNTLSSNNYHEGMTGCLQNGKISSGDTERIVVDLGQELNQNANNICDMDPSIPGNLTMDNLRIKNKCSEGCRHGGLQDTTMTDISESEEVVLKSLNMENESLERPVQDTLLDKTMSVFIRLRISLEKLNDQKLCPFNVLPLISLLEKCEEMYEI